MSLPADILDRILSFLHDDRDRLTLKACAQSHPTLSQLAERYLYAHIAVDHNGTLDSDRHSLAVLLADKPRIANYVRILEIQLTSKSTSSDLPTILSLLKLLTSITLSVCPAAIAWSWLSENFRTAFIELLHSPSLKNLTIIRILCFPLSLLNACKGVRDLTVESWTGGPDSVADDGNRPMLESLSIKHCGGGGDSLTTLINWAPTRNLQRLELSRLHNVLGFAKVPDLLANCSHSLKTLELDLGSEFRSYSNYSPSDDVVCQPTITNAIPFNLSSLSQLENLIIHAHLDFLFYESYMFGSALPSLTSLIKTTSSLKQLTLAFQFHLNKPATIPNPSQFICIPLVGFLNECRSPSIVMHVSAVCYLSRKFDATFLDVVLSVLAESAEINQLVEQGMLVVMPDAPPTPSAEPSSSQGTINVKASRNWLTRSLAFFDSNKSTRRQGM